MSAYRNHFLLQADTPGGPTLTGPFPTRTHASYWLMKHWVEAGVMDEDDDIEELIAQTDGISFLIAEHPGPDRRKMRFNRSLVTLDVLHENRIDEWDPVDIVQQCIDGSLVLAGHEIHTTSLTKRQMREALADSHSDPDFFGEDEEDE